MLDSLFLKWQFMSMADQENGKQAELDNDYEILQEQIRGHKRCYVNLGLEAQGVCNG